MAHAQTLNCVIFHREIFELDNYSPIPVETEEEYKLVVSRFPFHDAEIEKVISSSTIDLQTYASKARLILVITNMHMHVDT